MKLTKFVLPTIAAGSLALSFAACSAPSTNTAANKANSAVVTNSNSNSSATAANAASTSSGNAASTTNTATTAATGGDTIKFEEAGAQITVPSGFKVSKEGGATLVTTPDGGVEMLFMIPASNEDFQAAVDESAKELDKYIKDVKITQKGEKGDANGMPTVSSNGTGVDKENNKPVVWDMTVVNAPKKPVLVVSYADQASLEKHSADIDALVKSVKKM